MSKHLLSIVLLITGMTWGVVLNAQPSQIIRNPPKYADTVADIATDSFRDGQVIITKGRSSLADNGGNEYIYHSSGWAAGGFTDDGGHYIRIGATDAYIEAKDKTVANAKAFGAVANGIADDTTAIQAILNSNAKIKRFPAGTYRVTSQLTCNQEGSSLIGDSRGDTIIEFDLNDTNTDGLRWTNASGDYSQNNSISNIFFQETNLRADVRDVLSIEDPSAFILSNCTITGGLRYGVFMEFTIDTTLVNVKVRSSGVSNLYVPDSPTSTSLFVDKCYFTGAIAGPNVDINVVGAKFNSVLLESCLSNYGLQIRGGYADLMSCYAENNSLGDIIVGTGTGGASARIINFHSTDGPYEDPDATHIYADQYCDQLSIYSATMKVFPNSIKIHPSASNVTGMGNDWGVNEPEMTDASDIMDKGSVALFGVDPATGSQQWFGRVEGRFNNLYFNRSRAPDGLASAPPYSFEDDLDTGIFRIGDNRLGISLGGLTYGDINSTRARFATDKVVAKTFGFEAQAEPSAPTTSQSTSWQSNGTGVGDAGDVIMKVNNAGTTVNHRLSHNVNRKAGTTAERLTYDDDLTAADAWRVEWYDTQETQAFLWTGSAWIPWAKRLSYDHGSLSGAVTFDFDRSSTHTVTVTGATALTFDADMPGLYQGVVIQDGTGSHAITISTTVSGIPPVFDTTAGEKTSFQVIYDGTDWMWHGTEERGYALIRLEENATATTISASSSDWSNAVVIDLSTNGENLGATSDQANNRITIDTDGVWKIEATVSATGLGTATYRVGFFNNGTKFGTSEKFLTSTASEHKIPMQHHQSFSDGDDIDIRIENQTNDTDIVITHATLSATRIGN